jgi:DNA-binding CsgD family transcriptional regulator
MTSLLGEILEGEPLTPREQEILAGAAEGETAAQTGARLFLSSETVKSYRKRVIAKLGARNGTHAVALALRSGLLPLRGSFAPAREPARVPVLVSRHGRH